MNIENCYNTGDVAVKELSFGNTSKYFGFFVGGVVGEPMLGLIRYCYNIGNLSIPDELSEYAAIGSIAGYITYTTVSDSYYLEQEKIKAIGSGTNNGENVESKEKSAFESGEVAWLLREGSFGQSLNANGEYQNGESSPVLLAFDENKGKEVYQLTSNVEETESIIYRNAIESNLLPQTTYEEIMESAAEGQDLVWTTTDDKVFSGNTYKVTKDETLSGELKGVYNITTKVTPEGAGEISNIKKTAVNGEDVSFSLGITDGYKLLSVTMNEETLVDKNADGIYTFIMPEKDVTITATFEKIETGGGDNDDEGSISTKRYQLFLADRDFYQNDKYDAEGLVLFSRHDKRYAEVGGSFTVYYEKDGEVNAGDYRIFWSKSANGEYKEVKFDEVSGYYQIRNVQSDVYVKIYGRDGFPVSNEAIEATEARAYAQANKIIVVTHEPMDVQIVSMAGAVVGNAKVAGQQEFGNLAEGVYIVRLGDTVVKLQVRN